MQSDSIKNIAAAIVAVMNDVKGIEKSMTVGNGASSYKGVPDKEVKKIIGASMAKNGLAIIPTGVTAKTQVDRWEETGQYGVKQKQSVFTEASTTYLLTHTSGEFIQVAGYGHGVDSQDKGAGKATTYALKYALLYTFLVPTGTIDDADNEHSDDKQPPPPPSPVGELPWITESQFGQVLKRIAEGDAEAYDKANKAFRMKKEYREQLKKAAGK